MRHFYLALATLLGIAIGGLVVWSFQPSANYPTATSQEKTAENSTAEHPRHDEISVPFRERLSAIWERTWEDPIAFYTFVLSVFTGVLGIATISTLVIGIAQIKQSRAEFNAIHRPEIIVRTVAMRENDLPLGSVLGATVALVNKGATDAIIERIEGRIFIADPLSVLGSSLTISHSHPEH